MKNQQFNRIKWIHLRLTLTEYKELHTKFSRTTCRSLSQFIRSALLDRPLVATYRNASQDDVLGAMAALTGELNSIGNNINQTVKRLHTLQEGEFISWTARYVSESEQLLTKITEVKALLNTMAERWLQ